MAVDKQPNGWGAVFLPKNSQQGMAIRGCVPEAILKPFTCNKAYIYFLEAFAQVAAKSFFAPVAEEWTIHFIDNDSAKHAINKGYCELEPCAICWAHSGQHVPEQARNLDGKGILRGKPIR